MEQIAEKIALFQTLFKVCAFLSIVCLLIAIVLFLVLDIKNVIGYLTGRQAKKRIRELEESNAKSGRLMKRDKSMQYVNQKMKDDMGVRQPVKPGARKVEKVVENTALLKETDGSQDTTLLQNQTEQTKEKTEQPPSVQQNMEFTTTLGEDREVKGSFIIRREIMLIHAEEVI